jgi:hypothetical protein
MDLYDICAAEFALKSTGVFQFRNNSNKTTRKPKFAFWEYLALSPTPLTWAHWGCHGNQRGSGNNNYHAEDISAYWFFLIFKIKRECKQNNIQICKRKRQNIWVGIATGYWLDGRGVVVRVPIGARFFSSLRRPDQFWGSSSLLSNG